MESFKRER